MKWRDIDVFGEPIESRLFLSTSERSALGNGLTVLRKIRDEIERNYGGPDEAIHETFAESWIYAESELTAAVETMVDGCIVLPVRDCATDD